MNRLDSDTYCWCSLVSHQRLRKNRLFIYNFIGFTHPDNTVKPNHFRRSITMGSIFQTQTIIQVIFMSNITIPYYLSHFQEKRLPTACVREDSQDTSYSLEQSYFDEVRCHLRKIVIILLQCYFDLIRLIRQQLQIDALEQLYGWEPSRLKCQLRNTVNFLTMLQSKQSNCLRW